MKKGEMMGTAGVSCAKALVALLAAAAAFAAEAVTVNSVAALQNEIANATTGKEIIIAAGTYNLADETAMNAEGHLYVAIKKITLRGATGNPADVVLVERFFAGGGVAMNINIVSPETLRDVQKHPEKYENLQVRVAGWNIRWNDITRKEQDEYIARIETVGAVR